MSPSRSPFLLATSLLAAFLLTACPTQQSSDSKPAECKKFGDNCQFAPGKLGSCVIREPCPSGDCLVCQSQH